MLPGMMPSSPLPARTAPLRVTKTFAPEVPFLRDVVVVAVHDGPADQERRHASRGPHGPDDALHHSSRFVRGVSPAPRRPPPRSRRSAPCPRAGTRGRWSGRSTPAARMSSLAISMKCVPMRLPTPREPLCSRNQTRSASSRQTSMKWFPVPSVPSCVARWRAAVERGMAVDDRGVAPARARPGLGDGVGASPHAPRSLRPPLSVRPCGTARSIARRMPLEVVGKVARRRASCATAIIPQPMSTPTAAGMIAPTVGITLPTVAPMPEVDVRHRRDPPVDERQPRHVQELLLRLLLERHALHPSLHRHTLAALQELVALFGVPHASIIRRAVTIPARDGYRVKKSVGALLLLVAALPVASADEACGPLFTVERNVNANVVVYEAMHGSDGRLDPKKPVRVSSGDGREVGLNFFERSAPMRRRQARSRTPHSLSKCARFRTSRSVGAAWLRRGPHQVYGRSAVLSRFVSGNRGLFRPWPTLMFLKGRRPASR